MVSLRSVATCGAPPVSGEFGSEADVRDFTELLVGITGSGFDGAKNTTEKITHTVSAYRSSRGTYVASYAAYKSGFGELARMLPARDAVYLTRKGNGVFLALDVGLTFTDDWRSTASSGEPAEWRFLHASIHAGFSVGWWSGWRRLWSLASWVVWYGSWVRTGERGPDRCICLWRK